MLCVFPKVHTLVQFCMGLMLLVVSFDSAYLWKCREVLKKILLEHLLEHADARIVMFLSMYWPLLMQPRGGACSDAAPPLLACQHRRCALVCTRVAAHVRGSAVGYVKVLMQALSSHAACQCSTSVWHQPFDLFLAEAQVCFVHKTPSQLHVYVRIARSLRKYPPFS